MNLLDQRCLNHSLREAAVQCPSCKRFFCRECITEHDDRVLLAEAVRILSAERARAGADLSLANDPVSMLAYGLGARPAGTDLTSLEDLLHDLG